MDYREGYATSIRFPLPQLSQHGIPLRSIIAVHQEGIVFPARKGQSGLFCAVGKVQLNVGSIQHAPNRTLNFRIAGEKKCLQSHSVKVIECLGQNQVTNVTGLTLLPGLDLRPVQSFPGNMGEKENLSVAGSEYGRPASQLA
jgi:hypothetical protein